MESTFKIYKISRGDTNWLMVFSHELQVCLHSYVCVCVCVAVGNNNNNYFLESVKTIINLKTIYIQKDIDVEDSQRSLKD